MGYPEHLIIFTRHFSQMTYPELSHKQVMFFLGVQGKFTNRLPLNSSSRFSLALNSDLQVFPAVTSLCPFAHILLTPKDCLLVGGKFTKTHKNLSLKPLSPYIPFKNPQVINRGVQIQPTEDRLPSIDPNNKACLLFTGRCWTTKSYAKDSSPRIVKLQDVS